MILRQPVDCSCLPVRTGVEIKSLVGDTLAGDTVHPIGTGLGCLAPSIRQTEQTHQSLPDYRSSLA